MNEANALRGSCLCGAVQYRIDAPLGIVEHCHCSMCRKAHGAAFSTSAAVPAAALTVTAGSELISEYASSPNRSRCFCSRCGSPLFIRRLNAPDITVVAVATLDDIGAAAPARHVFVASKAPWHTIVDALPRFRIYLGFEAENDSPAE